MHSDFSTRFIESCHNISSHLVEDSEENVWLNFQEHYKKSKQKICQVIQKLEGTALIFGAGAGLDLPLFEMANQFKHIILVDIDTTYTKKTLMQLPFDLQNNFRIHEADITGIFAELSCHAERIASLSASYEDFIEGILNVLPTLKPKAFSCTEMNPSFICSSIVGSQLNATILVYLEKLSQEYFQKSFDTGKRNDEFCVWLEQMQIKHLDQIKQIVDPEGVVYFSDHFSLDNFVAFEGQEHNLVQLESLGAKKVHQFIQNHFSILRKSEWSWSHPVLTALCFGIYQSNLCIGFPTSMKRYQIKAYTLKLKPQIKSEVGS